jgi:formylglycine-generating enzyme required for sulfatase activity
MDGDECGGDDCCAYVNVPGGWFAMGRGTGAACASTPVAGAGCTASTVTCLSGGVTWGCPEGTWLSLGGDDAEDAGGADELPEHVVWIDGFSMDVYEVTVGRMRRFVEEYDKAALVSSLSAGAGEHPLIAGSEWSSSWDSRLPADAETLSEALQCDPSSQTWTDAASGNETFPINCVSWYLAYAFCAWDGGRIPTAAEWERTAAGGDENRLYPWGESDPDATLANYLMTDNSTFVDVHAKPLGAGRWGHQGLAGSVWEWVLDLHDEGWYAGGGNDCVNCANVAGEGARIMKGGDWQYHAVNLRAADLFAGSAASDWLGSGLRCVR